jgi:hypothetical protein
MENQIRLRNLHILLYVQQTQLELCKFFFVLLRLHHPLLRLSLRLPSYLQTRRTVV